MPENITALLNTWSEGKEGVWDRLFPAVYDELRRQARMALLKERPGHSLQPTELVHELFLRLAKRDEAMWNNREHFFRAAYMTLFRILKDHARRRNRKAGPGKTIHVPVDDGFDIDDPNAWSEGMQRMGLVLQRMEADESMHRCCNVVNLYFFAGLTHQEVADELGVSLNTVKNDWNFARAWMLRELKKIEKHGF